MKNCRNGSTYQKGHQSKGGRKAGIANKLSRDIKQGILDAAIRHGRNGRGAGGLSGFFDFAIKNDLKSFLMLMGRVIPLQINAAPGSFIGAVNIVGVPGNHFLSAEQIKAMQPEDQAPKVIDITSRVMTVDVDDDDGPPTTAEDVA